MENGSNQNTFENEQTTPTQGFGEAPTTASLDMGNGLSYGNDSIFGFEVNEDEGNDFDGGIAELDTTPFVQAGSAMLTPAYGDEIMSILPSAAKHVASSSDGTDVYLKSITRRQPHPTMYQYGTNVLMPLGASRFASMVAGSSAIALGAYDTYIPQMDALVPSLNTPGSYREVANWRRISDLKNTIISYYNRSIPFTDLSAADRFAIEVNYMRDICAVVMPIYAKAAAISLVHHWQKAGYQFDNAILTNLNNQSLERMLVQIYGAVAKLPSMDDVLMKRLSWFTKLRTTSKRSGFTPCIMLQDVTVGGITTYHLNNVAASSGYRITTDASAITDTVALNGTTFLEWLEMWLRSDVIAPAALQETLAQYLNLAYSIRTSYAILLGCAQQLEQKRSVQYSYIGEFLPIAKIDDYVIDYQSVGPTFSYSFKERVEYAPRLAAGEYSGGGAATWNFRIASLPNAAATSYSGLSVSRPVGLFKGAKCWNTKELVEIGLYKNASLPSTPPTFRQLLCLNLSVTVSFDSAPGAGSTWEDAYYGDFYRQNLVHAPVVATGATAVTFCQALDPIVSYYGIGAARNAPYCNASTYVARGGSITTTPLTIIEGTQILTWGNVSVNASATSGNLLRTVYYQLTALLEQLDLTLYFGSTKNDTGDICEPIFVMTGYRGAMFDDFDTAPLDNAMARAYHGLVSQLKIKAPGAHSEAQPN